MGLLDQLDQWNHRTNRITGPMESLDQWTHWTNGLTGPKELLDLWTHRTSWPSDQMGLFEPVDQSNHWTKWTNGTTGPSRPIGPLVTRPVDRWNQWTNQITGPQWNHWTNGASWLCGLYDRDSYTVLYTYSYFLFRLIKDNPVRWELEYGKIQNVW